MLPRPAKSPWMLPSVPNVQTLRKPCVQNWPSWRLNEAQRAVKPSESQGRKNMRHWKMHRRIPKPPRWRRRRMWRKCWRRIPQRKNARWTMRKEMPCYFPDTTSTLKTVKHGSRSTKREPVRETPKRKKVKRKTQGSSGELPSDSARATAIDLLLRAAAKAKAARQAAGEESEEEAPMPELPTPRIWGGWGGGNVQKQRRETGFTVM